MCGIYDISLPIALVLECRNAIIFGVGGCVRCVLLQSDHKTIKGDSTIAQEAGAGRGRWRRPKVFWFNPKLLSSESMVEYEELVVESCEMDNVDRVFCI